MESTRTTRILVVTDHARPAVGLIEAMRHRADTDDVQFRLVVPTPARAELHLLHPERHDRAAEAEQVLREALFDLDLAAGGRSLGSVSGRDRPRGAVEETPY